MTFDNIKKYRLLFIMPIVSIFLIMISSIIRYNIIEIYICLVGQLLYAILLYGIILSKEK